MDDWIENPVTGRAADVLHAYHVAGGDSQPHTELVVLLAAFLDKFALEHAQPALRAIANAGEDPRPLLRGFTRMVRLLADQYDPDL